jgi:hypothetical protein
MYAETRSAEFSVFAWLRIADGAGGVPSHVLDVLQTAPREITAHQGIVFLHWNATSLGEASGLAAALQTAAPPSDLVLLQVMSRLYGAECITIKDSRQDAR